MTSRPPADDPWISKTALWAGGMIVVSQPLATWMGLEVPGCEKAPVIVFYLFAGVGLYWLSLPLLLLGPMSLPMRDTGGRPMTHALVFATCLMVGIFASHVVRDLHLRSAARRGDELVLAIEEYERALGHPPRSLEQLVPHRLPSLPTTGLRNSPDFEYHRDSQRRKWSLVVAIPGPFGLRSELETGPLGDDRHLRTIGGWRLRDLD